MIFSHQMLCNHFHQPFFLHYHHPQVQALYHCHDLCITPANSWSTSRYAQVHPKMLQKRQSFHFWKISAHWAGLLGHPILSRQKVPRSQRLRQEKGSQRQSLNVGRSFCGKQVTRLNSLGAHKKQFFVWFYFPVKAHVINPINSKRVRSWQRLRATGVLSYLEPNFSSFVFFSAANDSSMVLYSNLVADVF